MAKHGFDFNDGEGGTLAAIKSNGKLIACIAYDEADGGGSSSTIDMPAEKAVEFARWIISQYALPEAGTIAYADIEAEIDHIEENGERLRKFSGMENEGRCRTLCAMYLREFILAHKLKLRIDEINRSQTSAE